MQSLGLSFWRKAYVTHAALKEKEELARLRVLRLQVQILSNPDLPPEEAGNSTDSQSTHASTDAASCRQPGDSAGEEGKEVVDSSCFSWMHRRSSKFWWVLGCVPPSVPFTPFSLPGILCASVALSIPSRMSLSSSQFKSPCPLIRAYMHHIAYPRVAVPHELRWKPFLP